MASRKKPTSAAMHEMRRLQHLGAEHMEGNFQHWVIENHCMLVDLVLAVGRRKHVYRGRIVPRLSRLPEDGASPLAGQSGSTD